ncbi:cytochrome D1 domain-containing protein [Ectobacillus polymachus]|uniref:cytochrome D1 domain-containing protein n=1 Tax=Ectobacillus polymachus TaxID=1508806 RepID=UPI003A888AD8
MKKWILFLSVWMSFTFLAACSKNSSVQTSAETTSTSHAMMMGHKEDNQPPRVYTMNEISNTVSVIDPSTNKFLMDIPLGDEDIHRPLYNGFIDVHGAWLSPNGKILLVTARGSSDVVKIDTETNKVVGYLPVGREPHAIMFTNDGKEAWVTIRGEDYIDVIDPETLTLKEKIKTVNGPGMPVFSNDGKYAFISSQKEDQVDIINMDTHKSVKKLTVGGKFSPFIMTTPDGSEVWVVNKDTSKITVIDAKALTVKSIFNVGPKPNHVHFITTKQGNFAYLSVTGDANQVEVYKTEDKTLVTKINVGKTPHGVMPNEDMSRLYVDNEVSNDVYVIDTTTNKVMIIIPVGKKPIDLIYKP